MQLVISPTLFGGGQCSLGLRREQRELGVVIRRRGSQNLAVEFDAGHFQAVHKLAVAETRRTRCRVNTDNPKRPILALLLLAACIGELERALDGFLSGPVQLTLR